MGPERIVTIQDPHRRKHFDFFRAMHSPHFLLTSHEDIGPLLRATRQRGLPFTPVLVWCLSKVAHDIPEFRWRLRETAIIEHPSVRPSFTVLTESSEVFSFCTVPYQPDVHSFIGKTAEVMEKMKHQPSLEDEPGKDDYLFMSAIPWVSFTSLQHAMPHPADSVPRIAWGKYYREGEQVRMPLSVQAHHALVDGIHMGRYFESFRLLAGSAEDWL